MSNQSFFDPPQLHRDIAIISSNPSLAASVSSAIGNEGEYVVVLSPPREWPVLTHVWDLDLIRIGNTLAIVQPKHLVLLQVSEKSASALRVKFPAIAVSSARTLDEALSLLKGMIRVGLTDALRCRSIDVAQGLLLAKRRSAFLLIDDNAPPISAISDPRPRSDHLVALDDDEDIAPIVAANYAFSIDADVELLPRRDDDLRNDVYAHIDSRIAHRGHKRGDQAERSLGEIEADLQPHLSFSPRKFVTFITRGFPYGYFWHDSPSTHIFSRGADISIPSNIYFAADSHDLVSAVMIDPGDFPNSETTEITRRLQTWGAAVTVLHDRDARVQDVRLFFRAFPADLFFICSHCGAVGGQRIQVRVLCHDGKEHLFEVDAVVNIASDIREIKGAEMVLVNEFLMAISMDGKDWSVVDNEFKADWTRFLESKGDIDDKVVSRKPTERIEHTTAIGLANGPYLLISLDAFDPSVSPIVFNNACVSFFDAASHMIAVGARCYIGTLAPVADEMARQFAIEVFESKESLQSLPLSIHTIQGRLWPDVRDRIYVHVGCHFCRLVPPNSSDSHKKLSRRITNSKARWQGYLARPKVVGKDTAEAFLEFLSKFKDTAAGSPLRTTD